MSKVYTIQSGLDRVNPEFQGISQKYSNKKKQRKKIEQKKHSLQNVYNRIQRTNETLDISLSRKKHELKYLKNVRQRYMDDIRHKIEKNQRKNQELQYLKMKSNSARKNHHFNLLEAIHTKYRENKNACDEVRQKLNGIKKSKVQQQRKLDNFYEIRAQEQEQQKQFSKSKINKFYRDKNKFLLTNYQTMIKDEQFKTEKSSKKIQFFETKTDKVRNRMKKKQQTLKSIEDEIQKFKITSLQLRNIPIEDHFDSRISGISKLSKRSRPSDILFGDKLQNRKVQKKNKKMRNKIDRSNYIKNEARNINNQDISDLKPITNQIIEKNQSATYINDENKSQKQKDLDQKAQQNQDPED